MQTEPYPDILTNFPALQYWLRYDAGRAGMNYLLRYDVDREKASLLHETQWVRPASAEQLMPAMDHMIAQWHLLDNLLRLEYGLDVPLEGLNEEVKASQQHFLRDCAMVSGGLLVLRQSLVKMLDHAEKLGLHANLSVGTPDGDATAIRLATSNPRIQENPHIEPTIEAELLARLQEKNEDLAHALYSMENQFRCMDGALGVVPEFASYQAHAMEQMQHLSTVVSHAVSDLVEYAQQPTEALKSPLRPIVTQANPVIHATGANVVSLEEFRNKRSQG